jgi:DNA-binding MarR family transcriptional regulator
MSKQARQLATELRTVVTRLVKKLRSQSSVANELSLTERSVIKQLDQNKEMLPSELAAVEQVTTQSMSQILNHLLALGYISRRSSDTDKRKVIISLSSAGQELLHQVRNERDEWLSKAMKDIFTKEELDMLSRVLVPLTKLLEID